MKKQLISLLTIATLGCSAAAVTEPEVQVTLELAQKYLREGNYLEAIEVFTALIEIDPKNTVLYMGRADAYVSVEEYVLASDDYSTVITIDDTMPEPWAYRGVLDYINDLPEAGESDFRHLSEMTEESEELNQRALQLIKDFLERVHASVIKTESGEGFEITVYEMPDGTKLVFIDMDGVPFGVRTIDESEELPEDLMSELITAFGWEDEGWGVRFQFNKDGTAVFSDLDGGNPSEYSWSYVADDKLGPDGFFMIAQGTDVDFSGDWSGMIGVPMYYDGKYLIALHSQNIPVALDGTPLYPVLPD